MTDAELRAFFDAAHTRHTVAATTFAVEPTEENRRRCFAAFEDAQLAFQQYAKGKPALNALASIGDLALELCED